MVALGFTLSIDKPKDNTMTEDKEELRVLFRRVKIEREVFHAVFHSNHIWPGMLPREDLIEFCQRRLKKVEYDFAVELRREDITECARCGEEGIGVDDEKNGDDKLFEIFARQDDPDSEFAGRYLCDECMTIDDNSIASNERRANKYDRA